MCTLAIIQLTATSVYTEGKQAITHLCLSDSATGIAASIHLDIWNSSPHGPPRTPSQLDGIRMARYLACGEKTYE